MLRLRQSKGFSLTISMIFLVLILASVTTLVVMTNNSVVQANTTSDQKRAYYVADAGIANAFNQLRATVNPAMNYTVGPVSYDMGNGKTGSYTVTVVGNGQVPYTQYTLTSTGTYNGKSKQLALSVKQQAVSTYAYLSNTEIHPSWGALWWITGMTTVGPTRTNGSLNIWGKPVYAGTVTQSGPSFNLWSGADNDPKFMNGYELNAKTVPLPADAMLSYISAVASNASGLTLDGATSIQFNANGTMNVTNLAKGWANTNMPLPSNGVIYVKNASATVQGTINGRATVASDQEIYISGNLAYNTNPRTNPGSTDMLGLVAKNNVTVLAAAAPAQLEIDAAMVALTGSFQVDQWWVTGKGNMIQYGSLVNNYCGPTGMFDPGTGILYGGYNQLQYYDNRLQAAIPPGFPPANDSSGKTIYVRLGFSEVT